jgi:hypothetical protein
MSTTIDKKSIEERIKEYRIEQACLQQQHEVMIAKFQQTEQEFRQRVGANQSRFQQIAGAIAELEQLLGAKKESTNDAPTKKEKRKHEEAPNRLK